MNLKEVSESSEVARLVFTEFSNRSRHRSRNDLRKMFYSLRQEKSGLKYEDLIEVFEKLESIGAGRIIVGRKNNPDRFVWNYNLKETAKAAYKGQGLESLDKIAVKKVSNRLAGVLAVRSEETLTPMVTLNISLDPKIPQKDLQALIEIIQSMQLKK